MINKILVVDDEVIFCNALRYHLIPKGYEVEASTSYVEFQHKMSSCRFDLALLDLHLPDINGLNLLLIAKKIDPDIKIIMVSSYLDHSNISKAKELGAYKCINKNSNMFQVLDKVIETI